MAKLDKQCKILGIEIETLELPKDKQGWQLDGNYYKKPEHVAMEYFRSQGYLCDCSEGRGILNMLQCAVLDTMEQLYRESAPVHYQELARYFCVSKYFEGICTTICDYSKHYKLLEKNKIITKDQKRNIPEAIILSESIKQASIDTIIENLDYKQQCLSAEYDRQLSIYDRDTVIKIWNSVEPDTWSEVFLDFFHAPYCYRSGWPDLTIVNDYILAFVEVKTSDYLSDDQFSVIEDILIPRGFCVKVLKVIPQKNR